MILQRSITIRNFKCGVELNKKREKIICRDKKKCFVWETANCITTLLHKYIVPD